MSDNIIEARGVGKEFNGVWVLKNIDFDLRRGEVHALVGENGAGKSTFIKLLSGVYSLSAGNFQMDGKDVKFSSVEQSELLGIRTVHQEINLVPYFSIYENIFIGSEMTRKFAGIKVIDDKKMRQRAKEVLKLMDVDCDVRKTVGNMNATMQKIVQICSVLVYEPRVVIFDEPTAALGENECEKLLNIIRKLKAQGLTIIYISHNLKEIEDIADRVTVFRNGEKVGLLEGADITTDKMIPLMLGDKTYSNYQRLTDYSTDEVVLEMENLCTDKLQNVSFQLHKGEVIGVAGVVGAGKTEIANAIFGLDKIRSGKLRVKDREIRHTPRSAIENGIALVPEERRTQGLIPDFPLTYNVTLTYLNRWVKHMVIQSKDETAVTRDYIGHLSIKTTGPKQMIKNLSGGNQQKVILSRWLAGDFEIGLFDEPTKGIDIKAKEDIYLLIDRLAKEGKSIMMMSSYLPELIFTCDRILVMRGGRLVGEFSTRGDGEDIENKITKVMLGGSQ
nr:sugar ABC transporter ATP-binding protein [uncultured Oscillibacter sp.]